MGAWRSNTGPPQVVPWVDLIGGMRAIDKHDEMIMTPEPSVWSLNMPPTLNNRGRNQGSLLMSALRWDSTDMVATALEKDPEVAQDPFFDDRFEPPLCAAVRCHCGGPVVRMLLDHGADPNITDARNRSPLSLLCAIPCPSSELGHAMALTMEREESSINVARLLVDVGAEIGALDDEGLCPMDHAIACQNFRLANMLERLPVRWRGGAV